MTWSTEDSRRVGVELGVAREQLKAWHNGNPPGSEIAFQVLRVTSDIHRRMAVRGPSLRRGSAAWPTYIHDEWERVEAFKQRMIDFSAGDSWEALFGIRASATPAEQTTLDAVSSIFRSCLVGPNQPRDWKVLHWLSASMHEKEVAKKMHISTPKVVNIKKIQCVAIWNGVRHLLIDPTAGALLRDAA